MPCNFSPFCKSCLALDLLDGKFDPAFGGKRLFDLRNGLVHILWVLHDEISIIFRGADVMDGDAGRSLWDFQKGAADLFDPVALEALDLELGPCANNLLLDFGVSNLLQRRHPDRRGLLAPISRLDFLK